MCSVAGVYEEENELDKNKEWYMSAVEGCLILRGMSKERAEGLICNYRLKERLDAFPEIQLHYDIEVTADEIVNNMEAGR